MMMMMMVDLRRDDGVEALVRRVRLLTCRAASEAPAHLSVAGVDKKIRYIGG